MSSGANSTHPLVTVVIPAYNYARFLPQALESVLAQDYPAVEIILVDDGSTDDTAAVARQYRSVTYIHQQNRGLAAARNTGIQRSRGEFVVFLDADDRLLPGALRAGVAALQPHPEAMFGAGAFRVIGEDGVVLETCNVASRHGYVYSELLRGNFIAALHSVVLRRSVFSNIGGFDEALPACEDYDIYLRIARRFPVVFHNNVVAEYRRHSAAMSTDAMLMMRVAVRVLRNQRPHLRNDAEKRAYREGLQFWRGYYGPAAARQYWRAWKLGGNRLDTAVQVMRLGTLAPVALTRGALRAAARLLR